MTKNENPLPAMLDRMSKVLSAAGVSLKRGQLVEIAAAAFGYRNSNVLTKLAKEGGLAPPAAVARGSYILVTGEEMIIAQDPVADAPFALDASFLEQVVEEERAEWFGVSPYGNLLDLRPLNDDTNIRTGASGKSVFVGIVTHKHGTDVYVAADEFSLNGEIYAYVSQSWDDVKSFASDYPAFDRMTAAEAVKAYFEICANHELNEYLDVTCETISNLRENNPGDLQAQ